MNGISIQSFSDKIVISIDRNVRNNDFILSSLRWFGLENMINSLNLSESVLELSDEIKQNIWEKRKQRLGTEI